MLRRITFPCQLHPHIRPSSTLSDINWFLSSLKTQGTNNLKTLKQAHCSIIVTGLHRDNLIVAKLLEACSDTGHLRYAYSVFTHQPFPNAYLHNTMIRALSLVDDDPNAHSIAVLVYRKFWSLCPKPDTFTFPFVLKIVVRLSDVWFGRQVHCQTVVFGFDSSVHVVTSLIRMYCSWGGLGDARKVFDEMPVRDATVWNALLAGYGKAGEVDEARRLLEMMPCWVRNVVSWTCVISAYAKKGRASEAVDVFQRMVRENVEPDEVTLLAALSACADLGSLELGERICSYVDHRGMKRGVSLNNAVIDMYAKSGDVTKALEEFERVSERNVVTWTTIITGLATHGLGGEALTMFNRMVEAGVRPNSVTFIAVLSACSHVGLVDLGKRLFTSMRSEYGIEQNIEHFGCLIDLLGRAGRLKEAEEVSKSMPFEANAAIWGSLLAASNVHHDLELGERALNQLIKLEPNNSGNYMLLGNLYADLGRWEESRMMRKMMKGTGVKKMAGESSIEVENRVCRFISGDLSNPLVVKIHELVQEIDLQIQSN
ncbi:Pentatricopeptide repeat-containing protein [Raphanus sativus]|uniref:Pentatricopeptide repeat-containing protein At5g56310-like n=1 Tax=Raphanus sativus TaxID=3726 RepID=A0A9W3DFJ8_RAPSA|nr:pentatricopeptide repeat-containing protein At5g56310-like [Raphanus sativus]KAJ4907711.1 Pentatricopeptide repeat-containing protein [Raphanus sativus]